MKTPTSAQRFRAILIFAGALAVAMAAALVGATWSRHSERNTALVASGRPTPKPVLGPVKPSRLADRLCATLHVLPGRRTAECCGTAPSNYLYEECVDLVSRALASGSVELEPAAIARCEQAMAVELSGCDWARPGLPLAPAACQGLIKGRVPSGGPCRSSLECTSNLHCAVAGGAAQGRCLPPVPLGASCGRSTDVIAAYVLDRTAESAHPWCTDFCSLVTHQCEPTPPEGAACRASAHCATGQRCSQGACRSDAGAVELAGTGQACRSDFECARGGCVASGTAGSGICGMACGSATLLPVHRR